MLSHTAQAPPAPRAPIAASPRGHGGSAAMD
eukprot:CAMPEP_0176287014 /NCGR_PEP_ID=MMETSP0121_2-20121125/53210_1 /TAXON_ID=160619 /ORGANISM="Kryptoperidinium foliaceum, Strain CCMP 1326" /LENGTH=30 /DNA_ID= /DNA_START= /DNA_END= /DNA_ORIENTATION=